VAAQKLHVICSGKWRFLERHGDSGFFGMFLEFLEVAELRNLQHRNGYLDCGATIKKLGQEFRSECYI
jgi:hypothetical protein